MGFWTEYFSTLLKGVSITAFKERIEVGRVINNLSSADHILYKSLFDKVENKHLVTRAIKEEAKLLKRLKTASDKAYSLIFNLSTEEMTLLKTVEDILKELEAFSKSAGNNAQLVKVQRDLALAIFEALKKAEAEDRGEFKQVMLVINEAEEKDPKKFMSAIRLAFQTETQQNLLAKFVARHEIRRVKVDILHLQKIPVMVKALRRRFLEKGKKESVEKLIGELYGTIQEIKKYLHDVFLELFLIKKRDLLLILKVLLDLHNLRVANIKWAREKHYIPNSAALEKNNVIKEIQADVSKHFHVIAQAFKIMITRIQRLEKEAELDWSKA